MHDIQLCDNGVKKTKIVKLGLKYMFLFCRLGTHRAPEV